MHNLLSLSILAAVATATATAQTIVAPFNGYYSYVDLGAPAGVPASFGGIVFKAGDPSHVLIGGGANGGNGAIYEIGVTRDNAGRITGFSGTATLYATAPQIDGGLAYGPGGVLFFTEYPNNAIGQIKPGSTAPDRTDGLSTLGINGSVGALAFVPPRFPHAGDLKVASYNGGTHMTLTLTPDGNGTYNLAGNNPSTTLSYGPEGLLYVPPGSGLIPDYQYALLAEYSTGSIGVYQLDSNANLMPGTRIPFMTGLSGAEGATTDPISGDLVFSTFGSNHVIAVHGFGVCGEFVGYGTGIAGTHGVPSIGGGGCAGRGQIADIQVTGGLANASGLLNGGFFQQQVPVFNGYILTELYASFFHQLDAQGRFTLQVGLPIDSNLSGLNVYFQAFYVDPAAAFGVSGTPGIRMTIR